MHNPIVNLIDKLRHKKPFEPFRIVTTTGDKVVVLDPFKMAIAKTRMVCFEPGTDRTTMIDFAQLAGVEVFQPLVIA